MSKIGRLPIKLPAQTTVRMVEGLARVKGPLGELTWQIPAGALVDVQDQVVAITNQQPNIPAMRAIHGLVRAKLANMVEGVSTGFNKILEISGVGFRAEVQDNEVRLQVGFSHPVKLAILPGASVKVTKNEVSITGIDKEVVGEMAARIRAAKPPEPYKGKGIKYQGEIIRRKQGKAAKTSIK